MRRIMIIGIGAGDPAQITVQAIDALNRANVFFIPDKGSEKAGLAQRRRDICARYVKGRAPRYAAYAIPPRAADGDYEANVAAWHAALEQIFASLIGALGEDECGAFLVWGDPALYDSTLRIVATVAAAGAVAFDYEVIPGISSVQALAARHRIALNGIGEPVLLTTGRRLAQGVAAEGSVVVLLDSGAALAAIDPADLDIYWGANIGTPQEALASGPLAEAKDAIAAARARVLREAGFVMDAYLLRRPRS